MFLRFTIFVRDNRDNHLNFFVPEREEEPFAVLRPQPVNAASVDCASQVVIHLVLILKNNNGDDVRIFYINMKEGEM